MHFKSIAANDSHILLIAYVLDLLSHSCRDATLGNILIYREQSFENKIGLFIYLFKKVSL